MRCTMALITLLDAQLAFGHVALLDHATFSLETNERVGLIGRNGAGKSSLLKILGGLAHTTMAHCTDSKVCALPMWRRNPSWTPRPPCLNPHRRAWPM
jgi:ATPase subunit of ABC transporter with duplicated ATPase domains